MKKDLKAKVFAIGIMMSIFFIIALSFVWQTGVGISDLEAATTNYSEVINGIQVVPIALPGQYTATAATVKFRLPFKAEVLGVSATARASGGTGPILEVDLTEDGTSILSSPMNITAGAITEGTVSDKSLADESSVGIQLNIRGVDSPTWNDITTLMTIRRTN